MNTRELLVLVRKEHARWEGLVQSLEEAHSKTPAISGAWSVKDIIAHIAWFEREMVGMLRARALVGSELWQLPTDERNQAVFELHRHRQLDEVVAEAAEVHEDLLGELQLLEDDDLLDPARFPGMPGDWKPWQVIAGNTYEHYRDHGHDLEAWLAKEA